MDKLSGMRAFVEIVDRGSMTAAAHHLRRSLPTLVRTLSALEADLGTRLLRRTTRRMALTDEGRGYLEHCRRILREIEEAERELSPDATEPRGEVRVSAPVSFGGRHVAPAVNRFLERYPEVRVDLALNDGVVDLLEESVDVAVRIGALADSSMIAMPVGHVRRVLCASPSLIERVGLPARPQELSSRPCIRFGALMAGPNWVFRKKGRDFSVRPEGNMACNQAGVAAEACAAGVGFSLLLSYQAAPLVREGRIVVVLEDYEPPPRPIHLVYSDTKLMPARQRAFLDWMRDELLPREDL